ncbi:MAG: hypothetical protein R3F14_22855 [Polyangiaceae bacterium]
MDAGARAALIVISKVDGERHAGRRGRDQDAPQGAGLGHGSAHRRLDYEASSRSARRRASSASPRPRAPSPAARCPTAKALVENGRAKLVDDVAGTDDDLTEKYLTEGDLTQAELDEGLGKAVTGGKLFPVYFALRRAPLRRRRLARRDR